MLLTVNADV